MIINYNNIFQLKSEKDNVSINSILIDLDNFNIQNNEIINLSKKYKLILLMTDQNALIKKYNVQFRFYKNIKTIFKCRLKLDINQFIDILMTTKDGLTKYMLDYLFNEKNINMIFLDACKDNIDIKGFKRIYDNVYLKNTEEKIIKNNGSKSISEFLIKVKTVSPMKKSFEKLNDYDSFENYDKIYKNLYDNFKLDFDSKNKNVIYTCITNNYDSLVNLTNIDTNNFDYICFTDKDIINDVYPWKIINISHLNNVLNLSKMMLAKFIKINPHIFLKRYEKSIWIDGNVDIVGNMTSFLKLMKDEQYILLSNNFKNLSLFNEIKYCIMEKKDTLCKLNRLNKLLILDDYKNYNDLIQTNVIMRNHNDENCINHMKIWWNYICSYTHVDKLLFNYIFWKYGGSYLSVPWEIMSIIYFNSTFKHGAI